MIPRRAHALALSGVALALAGYVISSERILREIARVRASAVPLRVEARLEDVRAEEARALVIELHPQRGARIRDDRGTRWLPRAGQALAPVGVDVPNWLPPADVLALSREDELARWLAEAGVDLSVSRLARCADADCFALGPRDASAQLWVDKDRFEVRRVSFASGRSAEFEGWREWDRRRFPERIRLLNGESLAGTLHVTAVTVAHDLSREDFSAAWLR